jgi:hypothetical protein
MAEWLKLQLRKGVTAEGDTLWPPAQSETMWTVHTPNAVSPASRELYPTTNFRGYGLGWALNDYRSHRVISHGGGYDGMFSRVMLVPEANLGVVVLTNSMTGISNAITNRILDAYLGGDPRDWSSILLTRENAAKERETQRRAAVVKQTVSATKPSRSLDAYAGTYGGPMYGDIAVASENGGLVLRFLPNPDLVADLRHLQFDTFLIEWRRPWPWFGSGTAHFVLSAAGVPERLELNVPNEDFWFEELELRRKR